MLCRRCHCLGTHLCSMTSAPSYTAWGSAVEPPACESPPSLLQAWLSSPGAAVQLRCCMKTPQVTLCCSWASLENVLRGARELHASPSAACPALHTAGQGLPKLHIPAGNRAAHGCFLSFLVQTEMPVLCLPVTLHGGTLQFPTGFPILSCDAYSHFSVLIRVMCCKYTSRPILGLKLIYFYQSWLTDKVLLCCLADLKFLGSRDLSPSASWYMEVHRGEH